MAEIGPVLAQIRTSLHLSGIEASLLTAVPVFFFGLCAPAAPALLRRFGVNRTVLAALAVVLLGTVVRLGPSWTTLLIGTALLGAGIAVANVLLPVLVKLHFPGRVGPITGLYTMTLNLAAAAAAGSIVPLSGAFGHSWRAGLAVWSIPVAAALLCWGVLASRRQGQATTGGHALRAGHPLSLLRNRRARAVVFFTASQSVIYYSILSWLPSIYQDHGISPLNAGILLSVTTLIGAPVALLLPSLAARARDQRRYVIVVAGCAAAGLFGLLLAPATAPYLWAILLGIGQGGAFPLALTFFVLRTTHAAQTATLSMVSQTIAYLLAALGPLAMGTLHDGTGSWTVPIMVLISCLCIEVLTGLRAARAGQITQATAAPNAAIAAVELHRATPNPPPTESRLTP